MIGDRFIVVRHALNTKLPIYNLHDYDNCPLTEIFLKEMNTHLHEINTINSELLLKNLSKHAGYFFSF